MDESSWLDALPIGILFFLGTLFAMTRKRAGRSLARRDYPRLAEQLALSFEAPPHPSGLGKIRGSYRGFDVLIDPEERARVVLFLKNGPSLDLRNYPKWKRPPPGLESFSFPQRGLNQWLVGRFASASLIEEGRVLDSLQPALAEFEPLRSRLREFSLDSERLECFFDFGSPSYLPTSHLRRLLPKLAAIAAVVVGNAPSSEKDASALS